MLAPMGAGFDIARLKLPLRFFRYFLSRPSFDIDRNPAVLTVMLQRPWRRARAVVVAAFVLILGAGVIHAVRSGSPVLVDDLSDSLLPLIAMAAFWAALTFGQKRLLASFGDSEVTVQEGGIRAPRWRWTVPIASFSGLAWRFHRTEERYEKHVFNEKTEYRLRAIPKETFFHWIELAHPDPDKTLILYMDQSEAGIRERLEHYSRRLDRPILASRVETSF
jgi:hypothetical protein